MLKTDSTSEVATVATPERGPYPVQPFAPRAASGTWPTAENGWHKTAVVQLHLGCLAELDKVFNVDHALPGPGVFNKYMLII